MDMEDEKRKDYLDVNSQCEKNYRLLLFGKPQALDVQQRALATFDRALGRQARVVLVNTQDGVDAFRNLVNNEKITFINPVSDFFSSMRKEFEDAGEDILMQWNIASVGSALAVSIDNIVKPYKEFIVERLNPWSFYQNIGMVVIRTIADKVSLLQSYQTLLDAMHQLFLSRVALVFFTNDSTFGLPFPILQMRSPHECILHLDLHSETQAACIYPWGEEVYYLFGVQFEKELWQKVIQKTLSAREAVVIRNIEQRNVILRGMGPEQLLRDLDAVRIDVSPSGNELFSIPDVTNQPMKLLRYTCPSTGRVYVKFVPYPLEKADEAQAWSHSLSIEEYQQLIQS